MGIVKTVAYNDHITKLILLNISLRSLEVFINNLGQYIYIYIYIIFTYILREIDRQIDR